jgi:hypothetical protein
MLPGAAQVVRKASLSFAAVLMLLLPAAAQVQLGDDVSLKANGNIVFGYSGDYGNQTQSSHGLSAGGDATISGFYYDPNFLSFNVAPYYDQSRANSDSASTSSASGVTSQVGIFGGSHFPGSINFSKADNSSGNFGMPGLPNFQTHGNSDNFGINWSEMVPDMPSLSVGYQRGSNEYSIYGTNDNGNSSFRGITLRSSYLLEGFNLGAFYSNSTSQSLTPEVLSSQQAETSHSDANVFGFSAGHALPWNGSWQAAFSRSDLNDDFAGYAFNGTIDSVNSGVSFQPTNKLHLSLSGTYSDNLTGSLYQSVFPATGNGTGTAGTPSAIILTNPSQSSNATDITGSATYTFFPNLQGQAYVDRRMQRFLGESYASTVYGGGVSYSRDLFGGQFNTNFSTAVNSSDSSSGSSIGFNSSANYSRHIGLWMVGGSFNYSQNMDTLLIAYMTSGYSYSAHVERRFGALTWTGGAGFSHSGLTGQPDTKSSSQSYSTGVGYKHWMSFGGSYSDSRGNGLQTSAGLTTTPLPVIIPPDLLILYGGKSYSASLASSPIWRLTIATAFSDTKSNTTSQGIASGNHFQSANALVQYQFRKMYLNGGYSRLMQSFSASGLPPAKVSSFSVGVGRWFNFF